VAGKEFDGSKSGTWIRPVSARENGELSEEDRRFENGKDPALFDVVEIPMIEPRPHGYQTENHLIDERLYWTNKGRATLDDVRKAVEAIKGPLWDNSSPSSYNGIHDRIADENAAKLKGSLKLVEVTDLVIEVGVEGAAFGRGKRKVRGHFSLDSVQYKLVVTDPVIERRYFDGADGTFKIGPAILCISLGEPYDGFAYKLIAAVITV
jgi:hypothetical protein